ncbi:MAG: FAD-binding protein [Thermosynechococcaceae cyanobacterium]
MLQTSKTLSNLQQLFHEWEPVDQGNNIIHTSTDFGNIVQGKPQLIARPETVSDLIRLIQCANQESISITPRGGGNSQSGQSISADGISLDVSCFNEIERLPGQVRCGASTTWRQLVEALGSQGQLPTVMPLNLDLTVGGTLSAGGFSANSHRYGATIDHVDALELVTGRGDVLSCNPQHHSDSFAAALGGLGQCAVITSATLALRPIKSQVRLFYLLYDSFNQWLDDQQRLSSEQQVDYLEGFCAATVQGLFKTSAGRRPLRHWLYGLHVGVEFNSEPSTKDSILEGLKYQQCLHVEDDAVIDFAARYDARFQAMKASRAWQQPHPWFECLLPLSAARDLIPKILHLLPPYFGDGHRVIFLAEQTSPPFFMKPSQLPAVVFAILPTGIPPNHLQSALKHLKTVHDWVIEAGGKRYLSGWLGMMTPVDWQQHYGDQSLAFHDLKRRLDPNHVLRSVLLP